jgi:hypothetical protein
MLFITKPKRGPAEYALLSTVYGLDEPDEDAPLMNRRDAMLAAKFFLQAVDDPDAVAQVLNVNNRELYTVTRPPNQPNVYLVAWASSAC